MNVVILLLNRALYIEYVWTRRLHGTVEQSPLNLLVERVSINPYKEHNGNDQPIPSRQSQSASTGIGDHCDCALINLIENLQ